ncbi:PAS domain-containing sensor histidine kinase [Rhodospira trueperi]|nr:PAS domain-containing protein [Rhodospira trueperi]
MTGGNTGGTHWLKDELYERVRTDPAIFDFLQNGSLDGLWYWDLEGMHEEWLSPRFKEVFGYADHEMDNTVDWWQSNIHPDDLKVALNNFEKHKADPTHPFDQVVRYRHRDGHTVWIRCRGMMIRDEAGRPVRMIGAHTDVTALKETERALNERAEEMEAQITELRDQEQRLESQARELVALAESLEENRTRLEALNVQKDKFFSVVAHDLRSPFTPLLGFSEILATQGGSLPPDRVVEYGALLHRAATEVHKLLEDLLSWSRIQLDRIEINPDAVDIGTLVATNIERYRYAAQAKGVSIEVEQTGMARAWADVSMLDTVLRNLISNAIKFTHPGDSITIRADMAADGVTLSVSDTGVGIAPDHLAGLFDVGARASLIGTGGETGTAMGLLICKEMMDRLEGSIDVESVQGEGTTFRLGLPPATGD